MLKNKGEYFMEKEKLNACPKCNSTNVDFITRICGYFSKVNNWSLSKLKELDLRQKGDYKIS